MRILLVDDEPDVSRTMKRFLLRHGHVVMCAESAIAALTTLEQFVPDVIISDFHMPGDMNGLALLREVATRYPTVRRVLLSGQAALSPMDRQHPIAEILEKPCPFSDLLRVCGPAPS